MDRHFSQLDIGDKFRFVDDEIPFLNNQSVNVKISDRYYISVPPIEIKNDFWSFGGTATVTKPILNGLVQKIIELSEDQAKDLLSLLPEGHPISKSLYGQLKNDKPVESIHWQAPKVSTNKDPRPLCMLCDQVARLKLSHETYSESKLVCTTHVNDIRLSGDTVEPLDGDWMLERYKKEPGEDDAQFPDTTLIEKLVGVSKEPDQDY